jgi:hypothetical protein
MGIVAAKNAPHISHLLFVDDIMLFFKAKADVVEQTKLLLTNYCATLGQRINYDKSSIFFIKKCRESIKEVVKEKVRGGERKGACV